jgi:hypothetical protein
MEKKMKKFIIIGFVFVMLLAMSAMATETRTWTMGNNNGVLIDDANIWMFPSTVMKYGNLLTADYYSYSSQFNYVGANWALDNSTKAVVGTYFSSYSGSDRMHFFYGQELGGKNFGAHLYLSQQSEKTEDQGNDLSESGDNYYNITLGLSDQGGQWDVALDFATANFQYTDIDGFKYQEGDGISEIALYGRYWKVRNPNYTQVYHLGISMDKYGSKYHYDTTPATPDDVYSTKYLSFDAGCGFNFTPSNHVLAVFDFGIMYNKYTYEDSNNPFDQTGKNFMLPYFKMGMDGEVFKWLDVRFGATSYWNNQKSEYSATYSYTQKYAENNTYFGLGFNFNHLHLDIEANPQFFFSGPDFLSGAGEDLGSYYGSMSATYEL